MAIQVTAFIVTTLLGSVLATSGMQGKAERVALAQSPEPAAEPQNPDGTEETKAQKNKKKQQQELQEQKQKQEKQRQEQLKKQREQEERKQEPPGAKPQPQQPQPQKQPPPQPQKQTTPQPQKPQAQPQKPQPQQTQQQSQKQQQEQQREVQLQKQQEQQLQQKKQQEQQKLQQKRVSQQEQQARIRKQEEQMALYRKNIALREELAKRDAQILRQQNRIQHLRFQEQYENRMRAQRAQLNQSRYDYSNDPYYYTAPNYRYRRDDRYYQTNQYGMKKLEKALQEGYNEGFHAGRADREDRWKYDYRSAFAYQDANYGYDGRYIAQDEYNHYFREGFQRGYDDGYYGRQKYGRKNESSGINDEWLIAGGVIAAIIGYELLTD